MFHRANRSYFHFAGSAGEARRTERGVSLPVGEEELRIDVIRGDIVRLAISRQGGIEDRPTPAVCADLPSPPPFTVTADATSVVLTTDRMTVHVNHTAAIHIARMDGTTVLRSARDRDGIAQSYGTLNDEFIVLRERADADLILGLGEKAGPSDRNGRRFLLWNTDVLAMDGESVLRHWPFDRDALRDPTDITFDPYYMSIPFYCGIDPGSGAACGHFIDNSYPAYFDFTEKGAAHIHFAGGTYVEYVFAGPALADVVEGFTWLTGRMPPPPLWALGYHQCRWKVYDETTFLAIADTFRRKEIPCDVLWLDIDHMDGFRVFTWAEERFPKHRTMLASLEARGFRVVTIIDPGVKADGAYAVYRDGRENGHFCRTESGAIYEGQVWPGRTAFPDFAEPRTRAWWAARVRDWALDGVAGAWIDMNEPSTGEIDPAPMRLAGGRISHARGHNLYALLMAEATVGGLRQARPEERPFVLSRAGSPGIQRFAANWLGDNCARWDHLWMSMPMTMGLGLSGQPFVGADIGGFARSTSGELLARWFQMGALSPFFRNHNCDAVDQYPWSFGRRWEQVCRDAVRLRYRLLPYIYTAFLQAAATGAPVQRPLIYAFQHDRGTWAVDDQYMLGDHVLVAPVYEPSAARREVYLPPGPWYDWHGDPAMKGAATERPVEGPVTTTVDTPADRIPLFVRGGAVIPLWPQPPATTMDHHPEVIELVIFVPTQDGETTSLLEEDDGLTLARDAGEFHRTAFTLTRAGTTLTLRARTTGRGYAAFRRRRFHIRFRGCNITDLIVDGQPTPVVDNAAEIANSGHNVDLSGTLSPFTAG